MVRRLALLAALLLAPAAVLAQAGLPQNSVPFAPGHGSSGWDFVGPCTNGLVLGWSAGVPGCQNTGTGSVTSVGLALPTSVFTISGSPVVSTGTLSGGFINQTGNMVFAGPVSGGTGTPGFRSLVGLDLPTPTFTSLGGVESIAPVSHEWINALSGATLQMSQPAFTDISGIASNAQIPTPTLSALGGVQAINPVTSNWVNSISLSGVPQLSQPTFNDIAGSLGPQQISSLPNLTILSNISGISPGVAAANPTTAIIDASFGSLQGDILYRGASAWTVLSPGTNGQVLTTGGPSANPTWNTVTGTGTVTSITCNGGLSGGVITGAGTCSLSAIANNDILSNISGSLGAPSGNTLTATIDSAIGSTQGNILFRGGSVWSVLAPGTNGQLLATQGTSANPKWESFSVNIQVFNSSGTYTPTTGMQYVIFECVGPGGGGGAAVGSTGTDVGGAGGGSGAYGRAHASAATVGASQVVTVGTGGAGGPAGANNGAAGSGSTSVGSICTAGAGGGGTYSSAAVQIPTSGVGGTAGTGDFTAGGNPGGGGFYNAASSVNIIALGLSIGGASVFGGAGIQSSGGAGGAATGCGSGGAGGYRHQSASNAAAGNGAAGCVIATEYIIH